MFIYVYSGTLIIFILLRHEVFFIFFASSYLPLDHAALIYLQCKYIVQLTCNSYLLYLLQLVAA